MLSKAVVRLQRLYVASSRGSRPFPADHVRGVFARVWRLLPFAFSPKRVDLRFSDRTNAGWHLPFISGGTSWRQVTTGLFRGAEFPEILNACPIGQRKIWPAALLWFIPNWVGLPVSWNQCARPSIQLRPSRARSAAASGGPQVPASYNSSGGA